MPVTFPDISDHIIDIVVGQSGAYIDGTIRTKMEKGADKARVRDSMPSHIKNVTILCTDIGRLQILDFYLYEARQTAMFFNWPRLNDVGENTLMKFTTPIQERQQTSVGVGLWEMILALEVRKLPAAPSATLIAEVEALFGSVAAFYAVNGLLPVELLQPQLEMWGGIDVPDGLIAEPDPAAAYYDFYLDVIEGDFAELLARLIEARNDAAALSLQIAAA